MYGAFILVYLVIGSRSKSKHKHQHWKTIKMSLNCPFRCGRVGLTYKVMSASAVIDYKFNNYWDGSCVRFVKGTGAWDGFLPNPTHLVRVLRISSIFGLGRLITEKRQKLCHLANSPSTPNTCLAYLPSTPNDVQFKDWQKMLSVFLALQVCIWFPIHKFWISVPLEVWDFFEFW